MRIRHVTLQDQSSLKLSLSQLQDVTQALQTQLDRDFTPIWGVHAQLQALDRGEKVPAHAWPMAILEKSDAGLGVHLDKNGKPFAEIQAGDDWSITASHEMLEMLVDPLGHKLRSDPDIDPASDKHLVEYLVEVGDPCEIFAYSINAINVSDFITPDFYNTNAPAGTDFDFLGRLSQAFDIPQGCYISWIDPQDGSGIKNRPTVPSLLPAKKPIRTRARGTSATSPSAKKKNRSRHDLLAIRRKYRPTAAKKTAGGS